MVKIKICGITNEQDATWAVNLGAHYVGVNFHRDSPRKVSPEMATRIVKKVPPFVPVIGVFVEQSAEEIVALAAKTGLAGVQLHGNHTPEDCRLIADRLEVILIKAFRLAGPADLGDLAAFTEACPYFLLDARVDGLVGGTGQVFPWDLAVQAKSHRRPLFLAGGLTADNVAEAVDVVSPFAVDVASGVEKSPRRKDYELMKRFIEAVRTAPC